MIKDFQGKQTYILNNDSTSYDKYEIYGSDSYITNRVNTGKLIITNYNINLKTISGTFEFSAIDKTTNTVVNVSDGRFDLTF